LNWYGLEYFSGKSTGKNLHRFVKLTRPYQGVCQGTIFVVKEYLPGTDLICVVNKEFPSGFVVPSELLEFSLLEWRTVTHGHFGLPKGTWLVVFVQEIEDQDVLSLSFEYYDSQGKLVGSEVMRSPLLMVAEA
jgi:hypothetical protein